MYRVNQELTAVIQERIETSPYAPHLRYLLEGALASVPSYLYGGALRNMLVKHIHGQEVYTTDYDILIDDRNIIIPYEQAFAGKGEWRINTIQNIIWKPEPEIKIELIPFSQIRPSRKKKQMPLSLDLMLATTDFTMNSVGYDLHHPVLVEEKAVSSIEKREIELLYVNATPAARLMARLIIYAERLQFTIGLKARQFVQRNYNSEVDIEIQKYLEIRKTPEEFEGIRQQLRAIASQQ